jgi:adenosylcobinamide kinase/adenosylcobinamide-phosphate guanylyltransferase
MVVGQKQLAPVTLVLGGARSGKSAFAEGLVNDSGLASLYLATAEPGDGEMMERIAKHRARRGDCWETREEALELLLAIRSASRPGTAVLVDCLTLWLSNLLGAGRDPEAEGDSLAAGLDGLPGPLVLVSNEVGQGIVPMNALARRFVDEAGRLHQKIAAQADEVYFCVAGLAQQIKPGATVAAEPAHE